MVLCHFERAGWYGACALRACQMRFYAGFLRNRFREGVLSKRRRRVMVQRLDNGGCARCNDICRVESVLRGRACVLDRGRRQSECQRCGELGRDKQSWRGCRIRCAGYGYDRPYRRRHHVQHPGGAVAFIPHDRSRQRVARCRLRLARTFRLVHGGVDEFDCVLRLYRCPPFVREYRFQAQ